MDTGCPCELLITDGVIDSELKLHLMLLFAEQRPRTGAATLGSRLGRSPWAIGEALAALVASGLLTRWRESGELMYTLSEDVVWLPLLRQLLAIYADPTRREAVYACTRHASSERQYREVLAQVGDAGPFDAAPGRAVGSPEGMLELVGSLPINAEG